MKACAKPRILGQGFQPCSRLFRERSAVVKEVGIGLLCRAANATAELIELRDSEMVRSINYQRVDPGHIDPVFYD